MEKRYQSNPDYAKALAVIAQQRAVLSRVRWTDAEYRQHMTMKNKEVSNRPGERAARRTRALGLWQQPEYRERQRRGRFGAPSISDALHGVTL